VTSYVVSELRRTVQQHCLLLCLRLNELLDLIECADGDTLELRLWRKYRIVGQEILEELELHALQHLALEASLARFGAGGGEADALRLPAELQECCGVAEDMLVRFIEYRDRLGTRSKLEV